MLAKHPLTGKPIRILNCEAALWKDAATLAWLTPDAEPQTERWGRYTTGAASVETWNALAAKGFEADVCILLGDELTAASWLQTGLWKKAAVVLTPRAVLHRIGIDAVRAMNVNNMLCLEEVHHLYPHIGEPWAGTTADAQVLAAAILRYCRTGPLAQPSRTVAGLSVVAELPPPAPLIFLTQYYRPDKAARRKEIDACLAKNIANPLIDQIVLLNESDDVVMPTQSPKVTAKSIGRRLNFADIVRWIYEEAPASSIVVFANSDIYLDETWRNLWTFNMNDTFLSLLRWDDGPDGEAPRLFGPRADSQDTWAVAADSVKSRKWNWDALDIPFGKGGCDNAINVEMLRQKFLVANPALTLVTHHVHQSGYRTYNPHDIMDRPMYMHIQPTALHDLKLEKTLPPPIATVGEPARILELHGAATASQERTFHTMATKAHKSVLVDGSTSPAFTVPIYKVQNTFVNYLGLPTTYSSILLGNTAAARAAWTNVETSKVIPAVPTEAVVAAHLPDAAVRSPATFAHRYLGKILAMRSILEGQGDFFAPNQPDIVELLKAFYWDGKQIPVLRRDPGANAYAKQALLWLPQDGAAAWTTATEVDALRKGLRVGWEPRAAPKSSVVVLVDGAWITNDTVKTLEREFPDEHIDVITPATPFVDSVETLLGSRAFVFKSAESAWNLLWALPIAAQAIEIQFEMSPTLESLHMAQVCRVKHYGIIKARDGKPTAQDYADVTKKIVAALGGSPAAAASPTPKATCAAEVPTLYMPAVDTKGFFSHAGDSFRELARLWERQGHLRIVFQEGLCNIWLGPVGHVLLYDRPTMEWLNRSPIHEREWTIALFGNPKPMGAPGGSAWTFWPRRPELVEELVAAGYADSPYTGRSRRIVFYGRSENAVQAERRAADWEAVMGPKDEFMHVKGMAPYPLSHREYLERLADARFGLCLAGYGNKCHREIECMAFGCVPVVAPEVDMDSYAVPPVEGVHYLRCRRPEDLPALLSGIDAARWTKMSVAAHVWWRNNASVEGSWALTKRLAGL